MNIPTTPVSPETVAPVTAPVTAPVAPVTAPVAPETVAPETVADTTTPETAVTAPETAVTAPETVADTNVSTTNKRKNKTDKWSEIEAEIKAIRANVELKAYPNVQSLITKVIENYKPKTGGSHLKDWSRRIENSLGEIIAKMDEYTGLWFTVDEKAIKNSPFSKGKYVTKKLLGVLRDVKDEVQAEAVALMMQGQCISDTNKLTIFNPNSTDKEVFEAVNALYPDRVAQVANDYNAEGKYLGASQEEAVQTLHTMGITDTVVSG